MDFIKAGLCIVGMCLLVNVASGFDTNTISFQKGALECAVAVIALFFGTRERNYGG